MLAANDGDLYLLWLDNRLLNVSGNTIAPYVEQWNGGAFVEDVVGDASYRGIGDAIADPSSPVLAVDPSGNAFAAWADTSSGASQIDFRGNSFTINTTQPFRYVNDSSTEGDAFSTATGSAANDGLSPGTPKDSIPDIAGNLAPGDVVYVDAGTYAGFALTSAANGVLFLGSPNSPTIIDGPVHLVDVSNLILEDISFQGGVTLTDCTDVTLTGDMIGAGITIVGGSGDQVVHDTIVVADSGTGLTLTDDAAGNAPAGTVIEYDQIAGGAGSRHHRQRRDRAPDALQRP